VCLFVTDDVLAIAFAIVGVADFYWLAFTA
jgi:hypothetical protein